MTESGMNRGILMARAQLSALWHSGNAAR